MIILLTGEDSYLAAQIIKQLKSKYLEKNPDGSELTEADYPEKPMDFANLHALPLFATSRLIIIKHLEALSAKDQEKLADYLTDVPPSTNVVIWTNNFDKLADTLKTNLKKANKIIDSFPLKGEALYKYVKELAKKSELELSKEEIESLIDQFGDNLWAISTEIMTLRNSDTKDKSAWGKKEKLDTLEIFRLMRRPDLQATSKYLLKFAKQGFEPEWTIGTVASAAKKLPLNIKKPILNLLIDIDYGLKTSFLDDETALLLLSRHLLQQSPNRLQWEKVWQEKT